MTKYAAYLLAKSHYFVSVL